MKYPTVYPYDLQARFQLSSYIFIEIFFYNLTLRSGVKLYTYILISTEITKNVLILQLFYT